MVNTRAGFPESSLPSARHKVLRGSEHLDSACIEDLVLKKSFECQCLAHAQADDVDAANLCHHFEVLDDVTRLHPLMGCVGGYSAAKVEEVLSVYCSAIRGGSRQPGVVGSVIV